MYDQLKTKEGQLPMTVFSRRRLAQPAANDGNNSWNPHFIIIKF
jgi:hypothetical protein